MNEVSLPEGDTAELSKYLVSELGGEVAVEPAPRVMARGLRTDVYAFGLTGRGLSEAWSGPLVLRLMPADLPAAAIEREAEVHRFLRYAGYPTPELLAVETSRGVLGRPFTIMERAPGVTMSRRLMSRNLFRTHALATAFADAHVKLHRLPVERFPSQSGGSSVERQLRSYRGWLGSEPEAAEWFEWLDARKSFVVPEHESVCHYNFHPGNTIVDDMGALRVVDWSTANIGDYHSDVADTIVFIRTEPIRESSRLRALSRQIGRRLFVKQYLRRYNSQLALDPQRLRYWEALRAIAWRGTVRALTPMALARYESVSESFAQQEAALEQYCRKRMAEFDAAL